jgi:hemerythrin-like metal-binding protein
MRFMEWKPEMSVGSEVLDGHHRLIIDCLNDLHPLLETPGQDDRMRVVLDRLENFVLIHFSEEEQAMRKAGYPDWRAHKEQHDKMYDVVFSLKSDIEHGRALDASRLFTLIYDWLLKHILGEDKKYQPYLDNPQPETASVWHRANGREV